jgi:hypothetical protein
MWDVAGGYSWGGRIYINTNSKVGSFASLFGHELLHKLRKDQPGIYIFFEGAAKLRIREVESYRTKYNYVQDSESSVIEEMLGDFVGDALTDRHDITSTQQTDGKNPPPLFLVLPR